MIPDTEEGLRPLLEDIQKRLIRIEENQVLTDQEKKDRSAWIKKVLLEDGWLTWGKHSSDAGFSKLFPHNTTFHRAVRSVLDLYGFRILIERTDNETFYYREGFDIEPILKAHEWSNRRADDRKFAMELVEEIVLKSQTGNIDSEVKRLFPNRSDNWLSDLADTVIGQSKTKFKVAWKGASWAFSDQVWASLKAKAEKEACQPTCRGAFDG